MGLLDDIAELGRLRDQSVAGFDVKTRLEQAQQKMDAMNAAMAPPTTSPEIEARRVEVTATLRNVSPTSTWVNGQPVVSLDLLVELPSGIPLPFQRAEAVPQVYLVRLVPGAALPVSLDPATPSSLRIEWAKTA